MTLLEIYIKIPYIQYYDGKREKIMPISNYFIVKILNRIRLLSIYEEDDIDMMRYSLQAILWEIEKALFLFLLFALMGRYDYFLITLVTLLSIRVNAGGYHAKTSLGCFIFSFLMFFISIMVLPMLSLNSIGIIAISIFSLSVTIVAAPICSPEKQAIQGKEKDLNKKITSLAITLVWLALVYIFKEHTYAQPVLWMIFLQNAQLLLEYVRRRDEHVS